MKLVLRLTTLSQVFLLVWATASVQFKFVSFYNSDHNDYDGGCCDDFFGGCDDFCDNYFFVCIDGDDTGPLGTSCDMAAITTAKLHEDNDNFNFPSTIPNLIANPYTMRVDSWSGSMEVFVRVWDLDTQNNDDEIDRDRRTIYKAAARSLSGATWQQYSLGSRTQIDFSFQVRVYCDSYYYGSDCSVHCIPRDDQYGHYRCHSNTGAKICYSGWEGSNCELDYDECQSNPCANGACVNGVDQFSCSCTDGWTGTTCNIDVDDCASTPCKNGGTCHDHVAFFTCACPPGFVYADVFCEYDDCAGQPCQNGATCNDLIEQFQCVCPVGYFGDLCEVDIDFCINQTCANNGTCVDRVDGFHCLCETGYEGFLCDVETDECSSNPCLHNGTCHDLIGKYQCACQEGYEGTHCDLETDECLSSPCRNNATCEDEFAGYHCHCVDGYDGDTCEMDIDECASNPCYANETCVDEINGFWCLRLNLCDYDPCMNNATCVDDYPGFICECAAGYGGKTCDQDIDECGSSPCLHQGTCTDHLDGYTCLCPPGYGGEKCHSETNECNSSPCLNGICWDLINGYVCNCTAGYEGVLCQSEIDECASSPCEHGTCVDELNGYRCECDVFYEGTQCDTVIDKPCALKDPPCQNGTCENTNSANDYNYKCTCDDGFYGTNCDIDSKLYGAVVFVTGKLEDKSAFETKLANLLQKLYAPQSRVRRDTGETVSVKIILTEDYVKSTDSSPLTKVTFLAWTESGYLQKDTIEALIDGASTDLPAQYGLDIYKGSAEPNTGNPSENWIGSNWYIILVVVVVVALVVAVGFISYQKGYINRAKDAAIKYQGRDRGQSALPLDLETPYNTRIGEGDIAYSTRIRDDAPTLPKRPARPNMVESFNPAYISSCEQPDLCGSAAACADDSGFFVALDGGKEKADNHYADIPALKAEAIAQENPYSAIGH
ncbi:protein jagged-1-like [Patiria miniata]|uniref:Delta-like protein n=1 Tax=Patiria miniata TaxID=46514 RepID=A0A914A3N8_PATMI|nr:protein jagged-1-like [Patiria miniata]